MTREKHATTPMRTCIVCRTRRPKNELLRHVHADGRTLENGPEGAAPDTRTRRMTGSMVPDPTATMAGRGYYLCGSPACCEKFAATAQRRRKR